MNRKANELIQKITEQYQLSSEDQEVVLFGFNLLINSIIGYGAILILAYILDIFTSVFVITITASLFRAFTGGAHANSPVKCILYGAGIFNILGGIAVSIGNIIPNTRYIFFFIALSLFIAIISFYFYAPADTPGKPIATKIQKEKLRIFAYSFLCLWGLFFSIRGATTDKHLVVASSIGLLWQSVSLWPVTYRVFGHKKATKGV